MLLLWNKYNFLLFHIISLILIIISINKSLLQWKRKLRFFNNGTDYGILTSTDLVWGRTNYLWGRANIRGNCRLSSPLTYGVCWLIFFKCSNLQVIIRTRGDWTFTSLELFQKSISCTLGSSPIRALGWCDFLLMSAFSGSNYTL